MDSATIRATDDRTFVIDTNATMQYDTSSAVVRGVLGPQYDALVTAVANAINVLATTQDTMDRGVLIGLSRIVILADAKAKSGL
jgi:hypothetical protein